MRACVACVPALPYLPTLPCLTLPYLNVLHPASRRTYVSQSVSQVSQHTQRTTVLLPVSLSSIPTYLPACLPSLTRLDLLFTLTPGADPTQTSQTRPDQTIRGHRPYIHTYINPTLSPDPTSLFAFVRAALICRRYCVALTYLLSGIEQPSPNHPEPLPEL